MKRISFLHSYIIDEEFQYSYVLYSLLLLLFIVVSTFAVIIIWNNFRFYRGYLVSLPSNDQLLSWAQQNNVKTNSIEFVSQYIAQAKPYTFYKIIFSPILVIFIVNFFVIAVSSLYISYRISVPLRELKKRLERKLNLEMLKPPLH